MNNTNVKRQYRGRKTKREQKAEQMQRPANPYAERYKPARGLKNAVNCYILSKRS